MSEWQEIGDRIYRRRYESLDLNAGLIIADDSAVVIDSRAHHGQADELLADIARITRLPVKTLINTHYHWDHTFGNGRFELATIVGHVRTRAALIERGEQMRQSLLEAEWMPPEAEPLIGAVVITPPTVTFDDRTTLDISGRIIEIRYHGRGHTDSDVTVHIDDVCFAGDLIEESAPPAFGDSFPLEWPATLARLEPFLVGAVVPGHGDVVDPAFVVNQREEIAAAVRAAQGDEIDSPYPAQVMDSIRSRLDSV